MAVTSEKNVLEVMYDLATLNPKRCGTKTGSIPFCKHDVSYVVC